MFSKGFILTNSVEMSSVKKASLFIPFLRPPCFLLSRSLQFLRNLAIGIGSDYLQIDQLAPSLLGPYENIPPRMWSG